MAQPNPEIIDAIRNAYDEVISKVPLEYSTLEMKAYIAEFILKAAAQGETDYDGIVASVAHHIPEIIRQLFI